MTAPLNWLLWWRIAPQEMRVQLDRYRDLGLHESARGISFLFLTGAALLAMEQVAISAHKCWIASKDPAFKAYQMANELNSFSGTPRFLLVPAKHYGGKPLLVVQARGNSSRVEVFGPLMAEPLGARIGADIARWQAGNTACGAAA